MGERQSGGGLPGRRRVHPGGPASGQRSAAGPGAPASAARGTALDGAALEALLAATLRGGAVDAQGEQRAVAAFRAARAAGTHRTRTRRRDDWRPRTRWRAGRSMKTALSVALASLALGGVAVAGIGAVGSGDEGARDDRQGTRPSAGAPEQPQAGASAAPSVAGTAPADRPGTAQDTEAHCRAYEQVEGRGKALDATAWERLVAAAGGERRVAAYCARALEEAAAGGPGADSGADKANGTPAAGNSADAGRTPEPGNGAAAGNTPDPGTTAGVGGASGAGNGTDPGGAAGNGQEQNGNDRATGGKP
ncbi:hypothetical protein [Streptomyces bullii]|uniref:Uncharacterized protein n=1 Tax=Streptomyces bullii TaxID=349910 RepID=A0ABW0UPI6_9ACTN